MYDMGKATKKRGFQPIEWTKEEIMDIIEFGRCIRSGVKFSLINTSTSRQNPFLPSPDRIDNTKGYTKDNVQWVCWFYNSMKKDMSDDEVDWWLEQINLHKRNCDE